MKKKIFTIEIPDDDRQTGRYGRRSKKKETNSKGPQTTATDGLEDIKARIASLRKDMWEHAKAERFEDAAAARDTLRKWEQLELELG